MGFEARVVGKFLGRLREAGPVQGVADSRFESEFHGVAANVTGSVVSTVRQEDVRILQSCLGDGAEVRGVVEWHAERAGDEGVHRDVLALGEGAGLRGEAVGQG